MAGGSSSPVHHRSVTGSALAATGNGRTHGSLGTSGGLLDGGPRDGFSRPPRRVPRLGDRPSEPHRSGTAKRREAHPSCVHYCSSTAIRPYHGPIGEVCQAPARPRPRAPRRTRAARARETRQPTSAKPSRCPAGGRHERTACTVATRAATLSAREVGGSRWLCSPCARCRSGSLARLPGSIVAPLGQPGSRSVDTVARSARRRRASRVGGKAWAEPFPAVRALRNATSRA
jgi:hypothetical protein